jgi:hypothetical protein
MRRTRNFRQEAISQTNNLVAAASKAEITQEDGAVALNLTFYHSKKKSATLVVKMRSRGKKNFRPLFASQFSQSAADTARRGR